jgi:hypothetical protein
LIINGLLRAKRPRNDGFFTFGASSQDYLMYIRLAEGKGAGKKTTPARCHTFPTINQAGYCLTPLRPCRLIFLFLAFGKLVFFS